MWAPGCMNEWMGGWMDRHRHASLVGGRTDGPEARVEFVAGDAHPRAGG